MTIPARRRSSLRRPCAWSGIRARPPPRRTRATERSAAWRSRSTPRSCTRSRSSASSSPRAVRRPRARRARLPDARRDGLRRRDALPRRDGLPACASGRRRNRMGARRRRRSRVKVLHVHRIGGIGGSERHLLTLLPALAERGVEPRLPRARRPVACDPSRLLRGADACRSSGCRAPRDIDPRLALRVRRETRRADLVHTHLVHADVYGGAAASCAARRSSRRSTTTTRSARARSASSSAALARRATGWSRSPSRCSGSRWNVSACRRQGGGRSTTGSTSCRPRGGRIRRMTCRRTRACCSPSAADGAEGHRRRGAGACRTSAPATRGRARRARRGAQRAELERLAASCASVHLLGRVPDVAAWLRRADLLVHPARWEGFGLALLEAMLAVEARRRDERQLDPGDRRRRRDRRARPAGRPGRPGAPRSRVLDEPVGYGDARPRAARTPRVLASRAWPTEPSRSTDSTASSAASAPS